MTRVEQRNTARTWVRGGTILWEGWLKARPGMPVHYAIVYQNPDGRAFFVSVWDAYRQSNGPLDDDTRVQYVCEMFDHYSRTGDRHFPDQREWQRLRSNSSVHGKVMAMVPDHQEQMALF